MKFKKFSEQKWFNGAVIACIGVAFYVFLTNLDVVLGYINTVAGIFKPVILGFVFAYVLGPISHFFYYRLFKQIKSARTRWYLSVILTIAAVLLVMLLLVRMLIPQLIESIIMFSKNYDMYVKTLEGWLKGSFVESLVGAEQLETWTQNALSSVSAFVRNNSGLIINTVADSGKNIASTLIAFILAIYLMFERKQVSKAFVEFMGAVFSVGTRMKLMDFLLRCDTILMNFLWQSMIDALIIGCANAVFMFACGMQYTGLISVVVGVTNLIPNFGPVIGGVIGGFILLLVNPLHALLFIGFTCILQFTDGFILKPKLFSSSMGVSGLLILISSIVLGNLFGILGVLLSIPIAAVLCFIYRDYFLARRKNRQ